MAKTTTYWSDSDWPPWYIKEGANKGKGISDLTIRYFQDRLKDYDHRLQMQSIPRMEQEMVKGQNLICAADLLKTERRKKFAYFSDLPSMFTHPYTVLIKKDSWKKFSKKNESLSDFINRNHSLVDLLKNNKIILGINRGHQYLDNQDKIFKPYLDKKSPNIYVRTGEDVLSGLFSMLMKNRIDYMLGYPLDAEFELQKLNIREEYLALRIEEALNYDLSYIACTRSKEGKVIIDKINKILEDDRSKPAYREIYERWIGKDILNSYRRDYNKQYLSISPGI